MSEKERLQAELMERFSFTADELELNRAGKFSERQLANIQSKRRILPVGSVVAVSIGALIAYDIGTHQPSQGFDWEGAFQGFAFFGGAAFFFALLIWFVAYRSPLKNGPRMIAGPVVFEYRSLRRFNAKMKTMALKGGNTFWTKPFIHVSEEDRELISQIGDANSYVKKGAGKFELLSIEPTRNRGDK